MPPASRPLPQWKQFEIAVASFLAALEPNARVKQNAYLEDAHTGQPRQRDVFIETTYGGHVGITILVSCKRLIRKINEQDLDAFYGELLSSRANKGVLYSFGGFTGPALQKAKILGISCCILYENKPPELPTVLAYDSYIYWEKLRLVVQDLPLENEITWVELMELPAFGAEGSLMSALAEDYTLKRRETQKKNQGNALTKWPGILGCISAGNCARRGSACYSTRSIRLDHLSRQSRVLVSQRVVFNHR